MRLSAHMLVLNGETVVGRALHSLAGYVDEVVYVDAGSTDRTVEALKAVSREMGIGCVGVQLDPRDDFWFFSDDPATWRRQLPAGCCTGRRQLRRWDTARNVGLELCGGDYVFKLDADDEVVEKSGLQALLHYLDLRRGCDFVMCPYEVMRNGQVGSTVQYDRLWRRRPGVRFDLPIHEHLLGKVAVDGRPNWTMVAQGLRVRDWRDNPGEGVRIPYRNYKVWLLEYERRVEAGEALDPGFLLSAVDDVEEVDPAFAAELRERAGSST